MPKVTYIEHDGARHRVEVRVGLSLMREEFDGLTVRMPQGQH